MLRYGKAFKMAFKPWRLIVHAHTSINKEFISGQQSSARNFNAKLATLHMSKTHIPPSHITWVCVFKTYKKKQMLILFKREYCLHT